MEFLLVMAYVPDPWLSSSLRLVMRSGFVGLINMLLLWPGLLALHYLEYERLELPGKDQWVILLTNGLVGTVLAELLWLWACFLTSSLMATLGMSLTIPLTVLADKVYRDVQYPRLFFYGAGPTMGSFVVLALVQRRGSEWDPVLAALRFFASLPALAVRGLARACKWLCSPSCCCVRRRQRRRADVDVDVDDDGSAGESSRRRRRRSREGSGSGDRLLGDSDGDEDDEYGDGDGDRGRERRRSRDGGSADENDGDDDERLPIIDAVEDEDDDEEGGVDVGRTRTESSRHGVV